MNSISKENFYFAGLRPRFFALLVDFVLFCILFFPATKLVKGVWVLSASDHRWNNGLFITDPLCMIFLLIMFLYFFILEGIYGATLGKFLLGIKVANINGGKPGLAKSFLRNILRIIDGLPVLNILGIILILKSNEKTRFGDRIAGTRVVGFKKNY